MFEGYKKYLDDEDKYIIDLVVNTFGQYGGKTLEKTTHKENPWLIARNGYGDDIPSNELITKDSITLLKYVMSMIFQRKKIFISIF